MEAKPETDEPGAKRPVAKAEDRRYGHGPRAIGAVAARIVAGPLGRRGLAAAQLVADWPAVVGATLAETTFPLRIVFPRGERIGGTLHLRVVSGALALELAHLEPLILERVNGHFGYRAVARIAIAQGPMPHRPARRARVAPAAAAALDASLTRLIESVDDPTLKEALAGLGRRLAGDWQRP
jgi:hypothetical protein